jgi:hypothetical protein
VDVVWFKSVENGVNNVLICACESCERFISEVQQAHDQTGRLFCPDMSASSILSCVLLQKVQEHFMKLYETTVETCMMPVQQRMAS